MALIPPAAGRKEGPRVPTLMFCLQAAQHQKPSEDGGLESATCSRERSIHHGPIVSSLTTTADLGMHDGLSPVGIGPYRKPMILQSSFFTIPLWTHPSPTLSLTLLLLPTLIQH